MNSRQVTKAPDVLLQELNGEAVLLNMRNGQYYGLDESSYLMYKTLVSSSSIDAAYKILLQEFDVQPDQLSTDLAQFLSHLLENGLVTYTDGESE